MWRIPSTLYIMSIIYNNDLKSHSQLLQDLYVGGQLSVFSRSFELLDADEYTYTYMENNKHIFIMADADATLTSLGAQARQLV